MFPTLDVSAWPVDEAESAGGEEKLWLRDPSEDVLWLFKPRTERDGRVQGEDWAEKIAYEVAVLLGLPAAHVELAERDGQFGSVSRSLRLDGWELQHGAVLLGGIDPDLQIKSKARTGHTLTNIRRVLAEVAPPAGAAPSLPGAFDVFAGYLLLDALVANQDRHEENWAVLRSLTGDEVTGPAEPLRLSGTYDHGSSLGFNLTDQERERRVRDGSLARWAAKGRAQRFEQDTDGRLTLVALASKAAGMLEPEPRQHWKTVIDQLDVSELLRIVDRVPKLSVETRTFVSTLLDHNVGRLRSDY